MLTKCALCGGEVKPQRVEKVIRVEKDVVIVLVNAEVCQQCGEAYYTPKTVEKLQEMRKELKEAIKIEELCIPAGQTYLYKKEIEA
jgi:YgiT-type zinc finger domain-containing protein